MPQAPVGNVPARPCMSVPARRAADHSAGPPPGYGLLVAGAVVVVVAGDVVVVTGDVVVVTGEVVVLTGDVVVVTGDVVVVTGEVVVVAGEVVAEDCAGDCGTTAGVAD